MDAGELGEFVADEIVALHREFEAWFRGDLMDLGRVEAALAEDFTFISPGGGVVARAELMEGLRKGRGTRPIRIRIENPTLRFAGSGIVAATYEEWHEHADYTTGRQSSALFSVDADTPGGLRWRLVHETWITPPPRWAG